MRLYHPITRERLVVTEGTVARALKNGYVPSVTEILSIINEGDHLTRWFIKNCLEHFIENGDKAMALAFRDTTSADFGTTCHMLAECYVQGIEPTGVYDKRHWKSVDPYRKWVDDNVKEAVFCEVQFGDGELGYGGTADQLLRLKDGRLILADLKVKKHSNRFPMKPSLSYKYQLSAYRNHFKKQYGEMGIANLLLASPFGYTKSPKLMVFDYEDEDWTKGFECAKYMWYERFENMPHVDDNEAF